jgi:hypothetical protein
VPQVARRISKDLIAIARNSTEVYKGKPIDIRQVGRDLGVKYVLEGSIQSMGDQIRVTAQLIEADSGRQVWSERYDRPDDDLFAVQNDVTERIAATLGGWPARSVSQSRARVYSARWCENVRYGSLADILTVPRHVRFTPNNGSWAAHPSQHLAVL